MSARIIRGNALALPLADASVDLIVTSPPYFGLRSYQDGGEHYSGQIGSEPTPTQFVDALIAATREMVRVLKPSGSIWVNLGDKYAGGGMGGHGSGIKSPPQGAGNSYRRVKVDVPSKSLIGIPWRYALRCIDELGLILRAEVIWAKPNGLPESVTDRVRRSHEQWFHFTKEPRYYSAIDEIREEYLPSSLNRAQYATNAGPDGGTNGKSNGTLRSAREPGTTNPLGKLPGSVWTIPTQPLRVPPELGIDHFAAFPMEWPRRIIQGWSPAGVCTACGEGRRPVTSVTAVEGKSFSGKQQTDRGWGERDPRKRSLGVSAFDRNRAITGYACACPAPTISQTIEDRDEATGERVTRVVQVPDPSWVNPAPTTPGIVLDPFGGTGTTALVAGALGRTGISVDMSSDYCRLATWRTNDPKQIERAKRGPNQAKKPKPKPAEPVAEPIFIHPDQLDLFDGDAA